MCRDCLSRLSLVVIIISNLMAWRRVLPAATAGLRSGYRAAHRFLIHVILLLELLVRLLQAARQIQHFLLPLFLGLGTVSFAKCVAASLLALAARSPFNLRNSHRIQRHQLCCAVRRSMLGIAHEMAAVSPHLLGLATGGTSRVQRHPADCRDAAQYGVDLALDQRG